MLFLLGVNHHSAPLPFRERLAFSEDLLPQALARLTGTFGEALIVSTCNRVEVLVWSADARAAPAEVRAFLARERGVSVAEIERYSYHHRGPDAVRHLFQVATGIDSMILGEPQILGQVKRAYLTAREARATGPILEHLLQQGLATAKRVRTETGISRHAVSVSFAAVELARKIFDRLAGRTALLLGAGKMSELAARHLVASGVRVVVSSRTYHRAVVLGERLRGDVVNWDESLTLLPRVDIVVSGTAAPEIVLTREQVREALRHRRGRPLFLIDIAVPRDIDPAVNTLDGAYLYDIDDLQGVVEANLGERKAAAETARLMIETEVQAFERWLAALEITPTIVAVRETLLALGRGEVERFRRKLGPLSAEQQRAVEELARSLVQKILHRPITHLKASVERGDAASSVRMCREIFGIEDEDEPGAGAPGSAPPGEPPGPRRIVPGGRED